MADTKITGLLTPQVTTNPATDVLPIVNIADTLMAASGSTRKITVNQLLGAGGTATLASATITGDLTVKTNVLKVDTTNNRVGIGTATPITTLDVVSTATRSIGIANNLASVYASWKDGTDFTGYVGSGANLFPGLTRTDFGIDAVTSLILATADVERYRITSTGVATWSNVGGVAGTAMTLNATGLGVGVTPNRNLDIRQDQSAATIARVQNQSVNAAAYSQVNLSASGNNWGILVGSSAANSNRLEFVVDPSGTNLSVMRLDTSGNVGIGVTPSLWNNNYNALDIGQNGTICGRLGTSNTVDIVSNGYRNSAGNWVYKLATSNTACRYQLDGSTGAHIWYSGAAGTAGNTIAGFSSAAMTLDASGNLLVGTTSTATSSGNGFKVLQTTSGHFDPTVITAQNSGIYSCWDIYSTGGTAGYRFYVTSTGTINAVNTTISAISDARLKENVQDIDVGLGAILALKPRKFDWKEGKGKNIKGDRGFIAQEFEQVFPQLVDEWKDAAPEGEAPYKSVRQDLIPVLVKAIQELAARVQTLETR